MSTLTPAQQDAIAQTIAKMHLPQGLGDEGNACSIAAINLALTGELTDKVPDCMSLVIGKWIIVMQDAMPDDMRNSHEWRGLLPLAAGTGRTHEAERLALMMEWLWSVALPMVQPSADKLGFGAEWRAMCREQTVKAAWAAYAAAEEEEASAAAAADAAAASASAAAAWAATAAAYAAASAAADAAAAAMSTTSAWSNLAPCDMLRQMIEVGRG